MPTANGQPERLLSEESQGRCGIASRLRSVALYLWSSRGDIRQAIDRLRLISPKPAGRWLWSVRA